MSKSNAASEVWAKAGPAPGELRAAGSEDVRLSTGRFSSTEYGYRREDAGQCSVFTSKGLLVGERELEAGLIW